MALGSGRVWTKCFIGLWTAVYLHEGWSARALRLLRRLYGALAALLQQKPIPTLRIPRRHRLLELSSILRSSQLLFKRQDVRRGSLDQL